MTDKRFVQFDKNCSPYLSGEVAAFGLAEATKLIGRGIAHYVVKSGRADVNVWVSVDEKGKIAHEDVKPHDDDEQAAVAAAAGTGEEPEEAGEAEGKGSVEETAAVEEEPVEPTKPKRVRRRRAKL